MDHGTLSETGRWRPVVLPPAPPASSEAVRRVLQRNGRRDTAPELALRRQLHALGLRFLVDTAPAGTSRRRRADVVLRGSRIAIHVHGCFWHRCPEHFHAPKANAEWWQAKFDSIVARDADTERQLRAAGWLQVVVWEHEDMAQAARRIAVQDAERRQQRLDERPGGTRESHAPTQVASGSSRTSSSGVTVGGVHGSRWPGGGALAVMPTWLERRAAPRACPLPGNCCDMPKTWLSVRVDLLSGMHTGELWPTPGRILVVGPQHSFADLATAIDDAFARWDRSHLFEFTLPDGRRIGLPDDEWDDQPVLDAARVKVAKTAALGTEFRYVFDLGDDWVHRCTVAPRKVDPLDELGIVPDRPLPSWGWGAIPDQCGRDCDEDDGGDVPHPDRPVPTR